MMEANQTDATPAKRFVKQFLFCFALLSFALFVWKRADIFPWIGNCNPGGYADGSFMSYCHSSRFGDLEHNIYWNNLEPELINKVRDADVLFLGNSRTQYAFSTKAVSDFFERKDYSHYVFGFGMGSQNTVPEMLSEKYTLIPKAVIINADPFFTNRISGTNEAMLEETKSRRWELKAKRFLADQQKQVCASNSGGFLFSLMCMGVDETLYRRIEDGHWDVRFFRKNNNIPTGVDDKQKLGVSFDDALTIAEDFIKKLELEKQCVIITVTPRTQTPRAFAEKLSRQLGVKGIFPDLENLRTVDDSHLDPDSAMRWSEAVLDEAGPILDACNAR